MPKLQLAGPSLPPPLLQNGAGAFQRTPLLSIRATVIGPAQTLTPLRVR
ncbi:MAG: hypothetical protein KJ077_29905 [Anaerolineae bacterium]|nr:hypothetical protein [Anaerolineae bacterium]